MSRLSRSAAVKWSMRIFFLLASIELTLRLSSIVLERFGGGTLIEASDGDIVCIGDSNTFGIGAPAGESYPDQLQRLLRDHGDPAAVVNLGIPGSHADHAAARLEAFLQRATPRCVLITTGLNDFMHRDQLVAAGPRDGTRSEGGWERIGSALQCSKTVQVAQTAWNVLRGDLARPEFGGQSDWPDPSTVPAAERAAAYERARAAGGQPYFTWLAWYWRRSNGEVARAAWNEFTASAAFRESAPRLILPRTHYDWELAHLCGETPAPIPSDDLSGLARSYARHTQAVALLRAGRPAEARQEYDRIESSFEPRYPMFLAVHRAWCSLLERRFDAAATELEAAATAIERRAPFTEKNSPIGPGEVVGLVHALGAAATALLLAEPSATLDPFVARHPTSWDYAAACGACPDGVEWIATALVIDATKRAARDDIESARRKARGLGGGAPRTAGLRWLLERPNVSFATIRDRLPLDVPRIAWIGPRRVFFAALPAKELDAPIRPAFERIARLAETHHFRVLLVPYLDFQSVDANERLRRIAKAHDWPVVDAHARYTAAELGVDDKRRYFCPDRGHPNAAGYGLIAALAFEKLVEEKIAVAGRQ